tara:strand:- start:1421 stop:2245 length:825 start_codon:yes stop_codon:yes gene_type:complete
MKKIIIVLAVILLSMNISAQKKLKVKGNGDVIEEYNDLVGFNQLEISDGLEVSLMQTGNDGYRLRTDSNLFSSIKIEVVDSILRIYTSDRIRSSKKLEISITFQNLDRIALSQGAKLNGQNNMELSNLFLSCYDNSKFELDLEATKFQLEMNSGSSGAIQLRNDDAKMTLNDSAYLKGSISSDNLSLFINDRADMSIEGSSDNLNVVTSGSIDFKGSKLNAKKATVNASKASKIHVYASKQLNVYAKGKSYIYVYGNPEIEVDGLNDTSQIIKR